jgi:hypothetical protein
MVCHQAYDHLWNHFPLGPLTSGICYGVSAGSNKDGHLHGIATRDLNQARDSQGSCIEVREEHVWPETGWVHMKLITSIGFAKSLINDCMFFCDYIIFMVYLDDGIFLGSDDLQLQETIKEIHHLGLNIEDQGHPAD